MENSKFKELKDLAFAAKTESEWKQSMETIRQAVVGDTAAADALRKYCQGILPRKKEWWAKQANKPKFNAAPKMMFSAETDKAIGQLAAVLTKYINMKISNNQSGLTGYDDDMF